jgi:hypothetical protein
MARGILLDRNQNHYADFIHDVGRNIYPLIIATDYKPDGPDGVGNTLTLYEASGKLPKSTLH